VVPLGGGAVPCGGGGALWGSLGAPGVGSPAGSAMGRLATEAGCALVGEATALLRCRKQLG